jgi:hypothetical protein
MATIYDIDYTKAGIQMLPPDKRYPVMNAWVKAMLSPLQYLRDLWFGSYRTGSADSLYAPGTYGKYNRVVFNSSVYESLINGNTDAPTVATSWALVQQNFLGIEQRLLFNSQALVLTYALNSYLKTTYRQPTLQSDVYITPGTPTVGGFIVGATIGTAVGATGSTDTVGRSTPFYTSINFVIHIPAAVYAATTDKAIRGFVNKYNCIGINYSIVTY